MKVYHGTSADNLQSILTDGFDGFRADQLWTCSSGYNYFWNPADIKRSGRWDTMEEARREAIRLAKSSAEAGLAKAKDCRRVVFEVDIPREELCKDTSCENMEGAVLASGPIPASMITAVWIDEEPLDLLKGFFIANALGNDMRCEMEFSSLEQIIGNLFRHSDSAPSSICEILWEMELIPFDKSQLVCNSVGTI